MQNCERIQGQLLAMLYKLLDREEQQEVTAHLETCEVCRAALEKAKSQQSAIAEAAKQEFADVKFSPPASTKKIRKGEPTIAYQRPRTRWVRWVMAASVLLFAIGGGAAVFNFLSHKKAASSAKQQLADAQNAAAAKKAVLREKQQQIEAEMRAIHEQLKKLRNDWRAETKQVVDSKQKLQMTLRGPKKLQAGVRNVYHVNVHNREGPKQPKSLLVKLVEPKTGKEIFSDRINNNGKVELDLPDVVVGPDADLQFVVTTEVEAGKPMQISEQFSVVAPLYLTHLTTDRPMYRPGDTVRFRSLTLERFTLKPPSEDLRIVFKMLAPDKNTVVYQMSKSGHVSRTENGEPITGPDGEPVRGIGAGSYTIPANIAEGTYTLEVSEQQNRFPKQTREISIRRYKPPRFNKELELTRKSYGRGDEVEAKASASRAEGGVLANKRADAQVILDGRTIFRKTYKTDAEGKLTVKFKLPEKIERGEGTLAVTFFDGQPESIRETIPIVLNKMYVEYFPEGGDLVAGQPNRVYFQVRTPLGKPADLYGKLLDQTGETVAKLRTLTDDEKPGVNQGMGLFSFVPEMGKQYKLEIISPVNVTAVGDFPKVHTDGVVLSVPDGVVEDEIPVVLRSAEKDRNLFVGAYCRGNLLDSKTVAAKKGMETTLKLKTAPRVSGVYRITVLEKQEGGAPMRPVAERLIFRRAVEKVDIALTPDRHKDKNGNIVYFPGDPVNVQVKTTNEKQENQPAVLLLSVVDLSIIKMAREKTARTMPAHFYLTTEIRRPQELEYADFIVSDHPKAEKTLDLLLGTQGWRRFAEVKPAQLVQREGNEGRRFLKENGIDLPNQPGKTVNNMQLAMAKVDGKFGLQFLDMQRTIAKKEVQHEKLQDTRKVEAKQGDAAVAQAEVQVLEANEQYEQFLGNLLGYGVPALVIVLALASIGLIAVGAIRLSREQGGYAVLLGTGFSILGVVFVGLIAFVVVNVMDRGLEVGARDDMKMAKLAEQAKDGAVLRDEMAEAAPPMDDQAGAEPKAMPIDKFGGEMAPPMQMAPGMAPALPNPAQAAPQPERNLAIPPDNNDADRPRMKRERLAAPEPAAPQMPPGIPGRQQRPQADFGLEPGFVPPGGFPKNGNFGAMARMRIDEEKLRREGKFDQLAQIYMGRPCVLPPPVDPFVAREYAHEHTPDPKGIRSDFAQTLYWQPVFVTEQDGTGEFSFDLSDSITRFQVVAVAHTTDGRLGSAKIEIASRMPYSLTPTEPVEVSNTDTIILPVMAKNDTDIRQDLEIELDAKNLKLLKAGKLSGAIDGGQALTKYFHLQPTVVQGKADLLLSGSFGKAGADKIAKSFVIVPDGFPVVGSKSDLLEGVAKHIIELPDAKSLVDGTLKVKVQVFPSTLANLQSGLESMLRQPSGCFEQSSSSNYPNVLITQYLRETDQSAPEIKKRSENLMQSGYGKLVSFECRVPSDDKKRGYEWFGGTAPPHEALTAYGLLQFRDMAEVFPVDEKMVERTEKYLLGQRKPDGGFKRNPRALDSFGRAPQHITDAYIVWALTESGTKADLNKELDAMTAVASSSKDPYYLSLVGLSLLNSTRTKDGIATLKRLGDMQDDDGHLAGKETSITGSRGRNLQIETTALATLAWLRANRPADFQQNIEKAVRWIGKQRGGYGGFGATQSTILALKALIGYAKANKKTAEPGELRVFIGNEKEPASVLTFEAGAQGPLELEIPTDKLRSGENNPITVEMTGDNQFPHTLSWEYRTVKPVNPSKVPVKLTTSLSEPNAKEGELVQLNVKVKNETGKGQGMTIAIVGLPGGLALPDDLQLKDLTKLRDNGTKPGKISYWEKRGRELIFYWRDMAVDQEIEFSLDLTCRVPGDYRGPASRAYLYYDDDVKHWTEPLSIAIAPR